MEMRGFVTSSITYLNFTEGDVTVVDETGLPLVIKPHPSAPANRYYDEFRINQTLRLTTNDSIRSCQEFCQHHLNTSRSPDDRVRKILDQLNNLLKDNPSTTNVTLGFSYVVSLSMLERERKIYFPELDIVVVRGASIRDVIHPRSPEGQAIQEYRQQHQESTASGFHLRLIDNRDLCRSRYLFLAKQVIEVPAHRDPTKEDGVYYTYTQPDEMGNLKLVTGQLTFDEAEAKFGLHKTREEAMTAGDPASLLQAEKQRFQIEEHRLSSEFARERHEFSMEKLKQEEVIATLKQKLQRTELECQEMRARQDTFQREVDNFYEMREKERNTIHSALKMEREDRYQERQESRKDYYDERSHVRKDTSEWLKFVPAVCLGAAAVYAIFASKL